jgi:hypothetical protein
MADMVQRWRQVLDDAGYSFFVLGSQITWTALTSGNVDTPTADCILIGASGIQALQQDQISFHKFLAGNSKLTKQLAAHQILIDAGIFFGASGFWSNPTALAITDSANLAGSVGQSTPWWQSQRAVPIASMEESPVTYGSGNNKAVRVTTARPHNLDYKDGLGGDDHGIRQ